MNGKPAFFYQVLKSAGRIARRIPLQKNLCVLPPPRSRETGLFFAWMSSSTSSVSPIENKSHSSKPEISCKVLNLLALAPQEASKHKKSPPSSDKVSRGASFAQKAFLMSKIKVKTLVHRCSLLSDLHCSIENRTSRTDNSVPTTVALLLALAVGADHA